MAFEPVYDTAVPDTFRKLGTGQAVVEARLLPRPETRIAKVLSTSSTVTISAAEAFAGEARYSGRVNFKVLFETAGAGADVLDYNADFSDKVEAKGVTAATKTLFTATILDMDIIAAEEDVVKLAAVVEVTLYGCEREDVRFLSRGGDGIYTHEDRVSYGVLSARADETFIVSQTVTDLKGCTILDLESEAFTYKRTAEDDSVTLEGEAAINIAMKDERGMLSCRRIFIPIEQQIRADGARNGDAVTGGLSLRNTALSISGEGEECAAEIELTLSGECMCFKTIEITPAVDAFSLENELLPTIQSMAIGLPKGDITVESGIEGSVSIEDKLPLADAVLGTFGCRVNLSSVVAMSGKVKAEGMLGCNIVYYNAERNVSSTVYAQVPFSITVSADVDEGDSLGACAFVKDINVKIRRGNELGIRAELVVTLTPVKEQTRVIISELKVGEKRGPKEAAISVHIASSGETVWDIAKALGITPEEVVRQNPAVTIPCAGGERLIAYRRMTK